jgi:hypothetical protein
VLFALLLWLVLAASLCAFKSRERRLRGGMQQSSRRPAMSSKPAIKPTSTPLRTWPMLSNVIATIRKLKVRFWAKAKAKAKANAGRQRYLRYLYPTTPSHKTQHSTAATTLTFKMPPRKSRLRKREATPEPAEEEQPVDTTSTTVLNAEIEQVVEQPQPERELEPELEREDDAEHDEDADAQKKKKAKASKTPLKAAKSKAQPVAAAPVNDDDDDAVEHADTHVRDRELDAEFAEPLRAAAVSSAGQNAAPVRPSTRLIIKEMVLENFKSYAGTQLIGPFHKVRLPLSTFLTASFFDFF